MLLEWPFYKKYLHYSNVFPKYTPLTRYFAFFQQICTPLALFCIISLFFLTRAFASPLSTYFDSKELFCKCCHKVIVNKELLNKLELLRAILGNKPIIINSAYRCPKHNKEVGGVKNSWHIKGMAVDIKVKGLTPSYVAQQAKKAGFTFTKIYGNFTHIDIR